MDIKIIDYYTLAGCYDKKPIPKPNEYKVIFMDAMSDITSDYAVFNQEIYQYSIGCWKSIDEEIMAKKISAWLHPLQSEGSRLRTISGT